MKIYVVIALVQAQLIFTCKTSTVLGEPTHNLKSSDLKSMIFLLVIFFISSMAAITVVKASPASLGEDKLLAVSERSKLTTALLLSFVLRYSPL